MATSLSPGADGTAEVNAQFREVETALCRLQTLQDTYDQEMWDINSPGFSKLVHIHLHLSKTIGRLAAALEPMDHQLHHDGEVDVHAINDVIEPIMADLVLHAAQLANLIGKDLGAALRSRYQSNAARFAPESVFATL